MAELAWNHHRAGLIVASFDLSGVDLEGPSYVVQGLVRPHGLRRSDKSQGIWAL